MKQIIKQNEHIVKKVYQDSIAAELEIEPGDVLVSINDQKIQDVFDYRYMIQDEYIEVCIRKTDGEEWLLEIDKDYDEDLGIEFENDLMSEYRSCSNKCIFCFIDQMPPGMRDTLYFKDDDSRLSFLQGNYITLTNMNEEDVERIIKMHLAPINISVQTTNPELRCKMLNNRFAGEKLKYLDMLYDGNVEMNGQIVCCKGVNDGEELRRSISDLKKYLPFMRSVSVVPAGITKYREGLFDIKLFDKKEAEDIIDMIEEFQKEIFDEYGLHFVHASDEWYILADREFPEEDRYDGYIQLENGVGMMRLLLTEFQDYYEELLDSERSEEIKSNVERCISVATGKLAYSTIKKISDKMMEAFPKIKIKVFCIRNDFFGETITVAGLITGQDLIAQIKEKKEECDLGDILLIPSCMLRTGEEVFLDDITVTEIEKELGIKVVAVESGGRDFIEAVVSEGYHMERNNDSFGYVKAYD